MKISKGFTLLELIVVIVVLGVVSVSFSNILTRSLTAYKRSQEYQRIVNNGRMAQMRIAKKLREAMPLSLRVSSDNLCVEYLPVAASTLYQDLPETNPESSIEVLQTGLVLNAGTQYYVAVYPTFTQELYDTSGIVIAALSAISDPDPSDQLETLQLAVASRFRASPVNRLFIVKQPESICAESATNKMREYSGYTMQASQPTASTLTGGHLLLEYLVLQNGGAVEVFKHAQGTLHRNSLLKLNFLFRESDDLITLNREIMVRNVP